MSEPVRTSKNQVQRSKPGNGLDDSSWKENDFPEFPEQVGSSFPDPYNSSSDFPEDQFDNYEGGDIDDKNSLELKSKNLPNTPNSKDDSITKITIPSYLKCGISGTAGFFNGYVLGGIIGIFQGSSEIFQVGGSFRDPFSRSHIVNAMRLQGRRTGTFIGVYQLTKCSFASIRGKNDFVNSFAGGFFAGCIEMMKTKSPPIILISGVTSGVMLSILNVI